MSCPACSAVAPIRHRPPHWTPPSWPRPALPWTLRLPMRSPLPRRRPRSAHARVGRRCSASPPRWCSPLASPGSCVRNRRRFRPVRPLLLRHRLLQKTLRLPIRPLTAVRPTARWRLRNRPLRPQRPRQALLPLPQHRHRSSRARASLRRPSPLTRRPRLHDRWLQMPPPIPPLRPFRPLRPQRRQRRRLRHRHPPPTRHRHRHSRR